MAKFKILFMFILFIVASMQLSAKFKNVDLVINNSELVNNANQYSSILLVDDRPELEKEKIAIDVYETNLRLNKALPKTDNDRVLVIQLKKLYLYQENKKNSFYIQARAYEKNDKKKESYFWVNTLNTSLLNEFSDKETNDKISFILIDFIKEQLTFLPESYTEEFEVSDFDDIADLEKTYINSYNTDDLEDGIYYNYVSFSQQLPDEEIYNLKIKNEELKDVYIFNQTTHKEEKLKGGSIFGVVFEGNLYVQYEGRYIRLFRDFDNNDFYYNATKTSSSGFFVSAGLVGALVSLVIPSQTTKENNVIVLDHLSGIPSLRYKSVVKTRESIFTKNPKVLKEEVIEGDGSLKKNW